MSNSEPRTNSDSTQALGEEYQVFLNFRGLDTRYGFTDFLYHGLVEAGVHVFKDDEELCAGEVIGGNLLKAIDNSIIYIPIFSQTYASSKWCLRELAHMVADVSKSGGKKCILPIFLEVEPNNVKLRTPLYEDALLQHEKEFPHEVNAWRAALGVVGKIKGWNVQKNQSPAAIVKSVVEEVLKKLKTKEKLVTEYLVGLKDRVKECTNFLDVNHDDVRLIGIYGMGGIGKTTIAKVVFNELCSHFGKYCSFLDDIRERLTKEGIFQLQKKLLFDIVGSESVEKIDDSEEGMRRIGEILHNKKVLVVMDNVNEKDHIKKLLGNFKLHSGSKVIITTRDTSVLEVDGFKGQILQYEMRKMEDGPALQLFCRHAFGGDIPFDDDHRLSSEIVSSMGGLPLAITVIGSLLKGQKEAFWKETLGRLREVPEEQILEKLRISYDTLDKYQQQIFLDIACFFFNEKKTDAIYMWTDCQYFPIRGIEVLTKRCLIKILDNDKFWMHDQLIALGRRIVRGESQNDLRKQSRLWIAKEALQIMRIEEMKHKVQALEISSDGPLIEITNENLERLPDLRFLNLNGGTYVGDFAKCRSRLKWFSWSCSVLGQDLRRDNLDWHFRADNLYLDELVVCKFYKIDFKDDSKAWDLIKRARNLKLLSICSCSDITSIPDISRCSSLERLTLEGCSSLKRIESFIGHLQSLIELKIKGCWNFTDLPEEVGELVTLEHFSLSYCTELRELPGSLGNLTLLTKLDLSGTKIRIPRTINKLCCLQTLNLTNCHEIQELPELPTSLTYLLLHSKSLLSIPNLSKLTNLVKLELSDGSTYLEKSNVIPGCDLRWIGNLSRLKWLQLCLLNVPAPPELAFLSYLEELDLSHLDLKPLMQLSTSNWSFRNLSTLKILNCGEHIPLEGFLQLEKLFVTNCKRLQRLSIPSKLRKLRKMFVSKCSELVEIQVVGLLESLEHLDVNGCNSLTRISGLQYSKNLETLRIESCHVLANVEGLNQLDSLKSLIVYFCPMFRRLIDASCTKIPNDCKVIISYSEYSSGSPETIWGMSLKDCKEKILLSNKISFTIIFHLGGKKSSERFEFVGGIKRENEYFYPVTYEGLVADVKNFGFCLKRMWRGYPNFLHKIKSDKDVNIMLEDSYKEGFVVHLFVEGAVDSEWEGEYDEEMMEMLREEQRMKTDVYSDEYEAKWWDFFSSDSDSDSAPMGGESETHSTSSVDLVTPHISLTIRFHLGVKWFNSGNWGCIGGIEREKEVVDPDSVTYEGLIADVKNFGFHLKRMQYQVPRLIARKIECDRDVNSMLKDKYYRKGSLIHLLVEGEVDSEWEGEYDDKMMKMLREQRRMKFDVCSDENGAKGGASCPNEESNSAPVGGESETHVTSSVDDFELERGNAECLEATTLIAEKDSDNVKKQVEFHEEPRDKETLTSKCYGEEVFLNTLNKTQDGAEFDISGSNEVPDSASVGESETDGNSSIDDFRSEPGNTECFEATGNRRQMRDGRIGRCDSIDGGKTASIKDRKKDKDEIGEPANPSDFVGSIGQTCKGVEHYEKSCKATTEVEDQRDFSSVKRDKNVEIDRVPTKTGRGSGTGCASNPGRYPTERGRGRGRASSSRNGEGLSLGRDAASTLGRGMASNSGRDIASSSQSSTTSSLRRDRGSTSGKGTTLTSGRGMTLSLGMGRGSSSRTDTTKMGTTSNPRRAITSSSRSSASLSIRRGRGSTLGGGATVSSGRAMTLSLGMGRNSSSRTDTTKMGTASIPGWGITSSSPSGTSLSTGRGRGSTSGNETTASSRRGKTLSSGRGATKMGTSLRSGTNKGLSSAKAEPRTSRSLEEQ